MAAESPQGERGRDQDLRELLIFLLLLLLGFACLLLTAQLAVTPARTRWVAADMRSERDPDAILGTPMVRVPPLGEKALTPWDGGQFLTPEGTETVVPLATFVLAATSTPTPRTPVVTRTPVATPTPPPPTTRPTATATSFRPDTPSPTVTRTPTPIPSPTATSPLPTRPSTDTPTATRKPEAPPDVLSITPDWGYNHVDVPVVIRGANFFGTPAARLGSTDIIVSAATADTITGTVPAGIPPGIYDLTVTNPDGQSDRLPQAYTALRPPPSVFSITPDWGYNDADVAVVIQGANFFGIPTARLGGNDVPISAATADTLDGTVLAGIEPGVYALTVTNPDGQSDTLSPAYTALAPPTAETGYVATYGPGAPGSEGDDDHVQVIFFEVPQGAPGDLYIRIFDADTGGGGAGDIDEPIGVWDTAIAYTLRGGSGAYTHPNARSSHPGSDGINSGDTLLGQAVIGNDPAYHNNWSLVFGPFRDSAGECIDGKCVFKLVVQGDSGDDGNLYNVALSLSSSSNTPLEGSRVFAYSWTLLLTESRRPSLYPYVRPGTAVFEQYNWDMDYVSGSIMLRTPRRDITVSGSDISGDSLVFPDDAASSSHAVEDGEDGATWTVGLAGFSFPDPRNHITFWAVGDGTDLAIFTGPTMVPTP